MLDQSPINEKNKSYFHTSKSPLNSFLEDKRDASTYNHSENNEFSRNLGPSEYQKVVNQIKGIFYFSLKRRGE